MWVIPMHLETHSFIKLNMETVVYFPSVAKVIKTTINAGLNYSIENCDFLMCSTIKVQFAVGQS